jgi:hypothetical protein
MGRKFDRHHLPSWRPEPPFLPGRIAEPVEAPGARSGLPILQQSKREPSKEKYKELLAVLAVGRLRSRHWSSAELLGVDLATVRKLAAKVEPYLRADGTRIWSLMQLERQLRPEAYGRRRGGYLDRRRTRQEHLQLSMGPTGMTRLQEPQWPTPSCVVSIGRAAQMRAHDASSSIRTVEPIGYADAAGGQPPWDPPRREPPAVGRSVRCSPGLTVLPGAAG